MITLEDAQQPFDPNASLQELAQGRSLLSDAWLRFRRNKLAMFGLVLVSLLVLVALIAPFFVNDPTVLNRIRNEPPTNQHWFGLDSLGRDQLARVVYGIRLSLFIGFTAVALESLIGIGIGALSGWLGGWVDATLMRFVDILLGIPYILLAFAIISVAGRGVGAVTATIGLTAWLSTARPIRSGVIQAQIAMTPCRARV